MPEVIILRADYNNVKERIKDTLYTLLPPKRPSSVLLKPNLLSGNVPERAICTHPLLIKALIELLEDIGIRVSITDNPGVTGYGASIREAKKAGILDIAGDRFIFFVSGDILHSEYVINLPKFKTHSLTNPARSAERVNVKSRFTDSFPEFVALPWTRTQICCSAS
jgi:uncharacterized protein (DUF362 family)